MASPLKSFFKEFLIHEKYDQYLLNSFIDRKQTASILISSMIFSFLNAMEKSYTYSNIGNGFKAKGIFPINRVISLSSQYAVDYFDYDQQRLLRNYLLNSEEVLQYLFINENNRQITEKDYTNNLNRVFSDIKKSSQEDGICMENCEIGYEFS